MIYLKKIIKNNYEKFKNEPYIYEKKNDKFEPITYSKFIEHSLSIANDLKEFKNKKIIIYSENSTKLMECDLAITFYVGTSIVVSKEWKYDDLYNAIKEENVKCLIYSNRYKEIVEKLKKQFDIKYICMDDIKYNFKKEYLEMTPKPYEKLAKIVFSSGTTGRSKAVKLSLKNIFSGLNSLLRRCKFTESDSAYLFLPLNHTYAAVYNFLYSVIVGYKLYLATSTKNIGQELLETNPTIFCAVPLVYNNLLKAYGENVDKAFGKNIKYLFCGGAPLEKETRRIYKEKHLNLMQAYALSETASSFAIAYPYTDDLESVGQIFEDIDVKIVDKDKDGIGEIIVKGDNVFLGYTDESLNKRVFDKNGYFHTGDLGYIKDKKLFLKGRKKKMLLTSNGENIEASYIENKIKSLNKNIADVKAYIRNDKIAANIYITNQTDIDKTIKEYNENAPRYEKINEYFTFEDSIDTRLKQ